MAERYDFSLNRWVNDPILSKQARELPVPTTPPRAGVWHHPAFRRRLAWSHLAVLLGLIGLMFGAMYIASVTQDSRFLIGSVFLWIVGGPIVAAAATRKERESSTEDTQLLEDPGDREVCLVEVEIRAERSGPILTGTFASMGTDRGVAWFENGALLFSGRRTSFAIGGEDVLPRSQWTIPYDALRTAGFALPLRTKGRAYLVLSPLEGEEDQAERAETFRFRLSGFRLQPTASKNVQRQWPPLEPGS